LQRVAPFEQRRHGVQRSRPEGSEDLLVKIRPQRAGMRRIEIGGCGSIQRREAERRKSRGIGVGVGRPHVASRCPRRARGHRSEIDACVDGILSNGERDALLGSHLHLADDKSQLTPIGIDEVGTRLINIARSDRQAKLYEGPFVEPSFSRVGETGGTKVSIRARQAVALRRRGPRSHHGRGRRLLDRRGPTRARIIIRRLGVEHRLPHTSLERDGSPERIDELLAIDTKSECTPDERTTRPSLRRETQHVDEA